mgnify:CR=1 FL=1
MHEFDTPEVITLQDMTSEQGLDFVPTSFDDYIGQTALKDKLKVYTQAAQMRNEPLDHMLLFGPPGLGKTTLSQIMAHVMQVTIKICSGPMLERTGDLVAILSGLDKKDILFIDEIHRMPTHVEEVLYSAMEHFRVDVILGQGAGAKSVSLPIAPFTLIGATTKTGMISAPLRSRFGINERLEFYSHEELQTIVLQNAQFLGTPFSSEGAFAIAKRARGTPRIAKKILRRVRDYAQVHNNNVADTPLVEIALQFLALDDDGLTKVDNMLLHKIIEHFNGGPVGLETLASLIGEDADTIETVYEPYLLQQGYLERTPRGRQIPSKKLAMLHKKYNGQNSIF